MMKLVMGGITSDKTDSRGDVRIQILRADKGKNVKGNISKSLTLKDVTVTEVNDWLIGQISGTEEKPKTAKAAKATATAK